MATDPSILAWIIPWTEEPVRLLSMGHKESDMTCLGLLFLQLLHMGHLDYLTLMASGTWVCGPTKQYIFEYF